MSMGVVKRMVLGVEGLEGLGGKLVVAAGRSFAFLFCWGTILGIYLSVGQANLI